MLYYKKNTNEYIQKVGFSAILSPGTPKFYFELLYISVVFRSLFPTTRLKMLRIRTNMNLNSTFSNCLWYLAWYSWNF